MSYFIYAKPDMGLSYLNLTPDDESAGVSNVTKLNLALDNVPLVFIPPGVYHLDGTAPTLPTNRWAIQGAAPAHHTYNQTNRSITTLMWHGAGYLFDIQPSPLPVNANNYGPYVINNLFLYSEETNNGFIRVGNESDTDRDNFQHRGVHIEGIGCNLAAQRWNNAFPLIFNSLLNDVPTNDSATINTTTERWPCIRIVKGQTTVLQNVNCQGGFWGADLISLDRGVLDNVRCAGQVFPIKHKSIDTYTQLAAVSDAWNVFVESPEGCGIWTDSAAIHNCRVECGYGRTRIGEYATAPVTAWSIAQGSDTINLTITGDAADYFEPDFPIKLTDSNGYEYWLLITNIPTSSTLIFAHADSQCHFAPLTTTGTIINRYFGFDLLAYGHRADFGGPLQIGCNDNIANMPLGFFVPTNGRMRCSGGVTGIGNIDQSNRLQVIGHVAGKQHWLAGGVDYIAGNNELAPDHPLCNRRNGWHNRDKNNWSQGPIDLVRPAEVWHFLPGHYTTSANGESKECLFQKDADGRWYEDLANSSTGRHFRLYGLDGATNISATYRVRLKSNTGSPVANVEIKETGAGGNAVLGTIASVTTSWAWYTGSFTTTKYTGTGTVPQIHINSPNVLFSELEITRTYP
jgi:hypothetical protein